MRVVSTVAPCCPLCRSAIPRSWKPAEMPACRPPSARTQERLFRDAQASRRVITLGNRHELVSNPKWSRNGKYLNKHKWAIFVHGQYEFIDRVLFKLGPLYTAWPSSDTRSQKFPSADGKWLDPLVSRAPFEVTRIGWGYFDVTVEIHWKRELRQPVTVLQHELCFEADGKARTHTVVFEHPELLQVADEPSHQNPPTGSQSQQRAPAGSRLQQRASAGGRSQQRAPAGRRSASRGRGAATSSRTASTRTTSSRATVVSS